MLIRPARVPPSPIERATRNLAYKRKFRLFMVIFHLWQLSIKARRFFLKIMLFLAYFPYFEKIKVGLWDHHAICVSVNPPYQLSNG
jgi:hypothetical protein